MPNPLVKLQAKRIAIGSVMGLLACLFVYGIYMWRSTDTPKTGSLNAILAGIDSYKRTYKAYPPTLSALGGAPEACTRVATAATACLIDNVLASGEKSGYRISYRPFDMKHDGRIEGFTITADPIYKGGTNQPHYFTDQTGVIRVEIGRPATATSPRVN